MVAIAVPMLGSLLIVMLPRPYAKWICAFAGGIATVASVGLAATFAGNGMNAVDVTWASMGQTLVMGFIFDRMSTLLAPAFVAIGLLVVIYSFPYMSDKNKEHPDAPRRRFYVYFSTFIGAMAGLAYSSTIVGQLVFFEITGVCVFARALASAGDIPEIVGWVAIIDAVVTMLFGFLMYLPQKDMKRLLAFSTIAQLAYVFFGLGLSVFGSQMAFNGAVEHIFNHAFTKTLFFLIAGSLSFTLGTRMLPKIQGLMKKYPVTGVGFAVAATAIAGVPPMSTFFSKFQIISGGFAVGASNTVIFVLVCVMVVETVATFAWFLRWMGKVLPGEPSETVAAGQPLPRAMAFVFVVLMIMVVVAGPLSSSWMG